MTTSNEPGYYQEGAFGIRVENVCVTIEATFNSSTTTTTTTATTTTTTTAAATTTTTTTTTAAAATADMPHALRKHKFCEFQTLTLTPMQSSLINISLLEDVELDWYNDYHRQVREQLMPMMQQYFPESVEFLINETEPIRR